MSSCLRFLLLKSLVFIALLHSIAASNVVFFPADQQSGTSIPELSVTLEAKGVWYKCGFKSWDASGWRVDSEPPTQEYTTYLVKKSDVRNIGYKGDGKKRYPSSAQGLCSRQVSCTAAVDAVYFNYFERCIVVSSDSTTTPLAFKIKASSKLEIKVIVLWSVGGAVALIIILLLLNCLWGCARSCCCPVNKYSRV